MITFKKGKRMAGATTQMAQSVRRPVVRSSGPAGITEFDPINDVPTQRTTVIINASAGSGAQASTAMRNGGRVQAANRVRVRTAGEGGVALPRRDYRPTILPEGTLELEARQA